MAMVVATGDTEDLEVDMDMVDLEADLEVALEALTQVLEVALSVVCLRPADVGAELPRDRPIAARATMSLILFLSLNQVNALPCDLSAHPSGALPLHRHAPMTASAEA